MKIKLIVAHDINLGIGCENKLVWDIPEDMKHFKNETMNKIVVMGSKTYYSIGKPLPSRVNAVLSSKKYLNKEFENNMLGLPNSVPKVVDGNLTYPDIYKNKIFHSKDELLDYYKDEDEIIVIGGESVYKEFLDVADELVVTVVLHMFKVDTYFPFYIDKFKEVERSEIMHSKTGYEYFVARYKKVD